jgi:flagellar biosynthesis anti-sigma factor FlgM
MKIQPNDPQATTGLTHSASLVGLGVSPTPTSGGRPAGAPDPVVRIELSARARELQAALAAAAAAPDVRADLVAEVKAKVESGNYPVDPATVARRMLDIRA